MKFHTDIDTTKMDDETLIHAEKMLQNDELHAKFSEKYLRYYPLANRVLVVASIWLAALDFKVYIDAVPGEDHDEEMQEVAKTGVKLPETMARLLFPTLKEFTYDRY